MDEKITVFKEQIEIDGKLEEAITIIVDGFLKHIVDELIDNSEYDSARDIFEDAFLRGINRKNKAH